MPPTPSQIREQLLKAIDQDAKVINMVCVLEAISCLESIQITKESLEETRLGKIVNDIRKNTDDSALSARCKKLVRVWSKQFVRGTPSTSKPASTSTQDASANRQPTPPSQGTTSNVSTGRNRTSSLKPHTSTTPASTTPTSTSTVDKKKSENRKRRKLITSPTTATSTGSVPTSAKKPRPAASTPTSNATKDETNLETKNGMPAQRDVGKSNLQSSKSAFSKVKPTETKLSSGASSPASKAKGTSFPGLCKVNANASKALSKSPISEQVSSPVNSKSSKLSPVVVGFPTAGKISPSVKVKQLTDSNSTDSSQLESYDTLSGQTDETSKDKLISSQPQSKSPIIPKSLQDSNSSSATVKLRPPSPEQCITPIQSACSTKTITYDNIQLVSQPIETASPQEKDCSKTSFSIFDDDYDEQHEIHSDEKYNKTLVDFEKGPVLPSLTLTTDSVKSSGGSHFDTPAADVDVEIDEPDRNNAFEVSPDQDEVLSEFQREQVPSKPVTEEDIAHVHDDQWEGVNGCYSNEREWFDWTQSLSISKQDDDALHILPYVCLD